MKIERPDWMLHYDMKENVKVSCVHEWFLREVEPINKMLSEGVETTGFKDDTYGWVFGVDPDRQIDTHKALLIGITPIEKKCPTCGK